MSLLTDFQRRGTYSLIRRIVRHGDPGIALPVATNGVLTFLLPKSDDDKKRQKKIETNKA